MKRSSLSAVAATAIFALSSLAGASANGSQLVVVTNNSSVCQRFDAVGVEPTTHPGHGLAMSHAGPEMTQVGLDFKLNAAPGATVTFEGLSSSRAYVWAHAHVAAGCDSAMTGRGSVRYATQGPRERVIFDGVHFKHEAFL